MADLWLLRSFHVCSILCIVSQLAWADSQITEIAQVTDIAPLIDSTNIVVSYNVNPNSWFAKKHQDDVFAKAAALASSRSEVKFAKVHTTESDFRSEIHVHQLGRDWVYGGPWEPDAIVQYLDGVLGLEKSAIDSSAGTVPEDLIEVTSEADLLEKMEEQEIALVGIFSNDAAQNAKYLQALAAAAKTMTSENTTVPCYYTTDAAAFEERFGLEGAPAVLIVKPFDFVEMEVPTDRLTDPVAIMDFVEDALTIQLPPTIQTFTQQNSRELFSNPLTQQLMVLMPEDSTDARLLLEGNARKWQTQVNYHETGVLDFLINTPLATAVARAGESLRDRRAQLLRPQDGRPAGRIHHRRGRAADRQVRGPERAYRGGKKRGQGEGCGPGA